MHNMGRYKYLQRQCPYHSLPNWLIVLTFYDQLSRQMNNNLDTAVNGSIIGMTMEDILQVVEKMATNSF